MISLELLVTQVSGLERQDLERWIGNHWVRAEGGDGHYQFHDIDIARIRLIQELRDELKINEDALPVVLSLLDQLYDLRRCLREFSDVLVRTAPPEMRPHLAAHLAKLTTHATDRRAP